MTTLNVVFFETLAQDGMTDIFAANNPPAHKTYRGILSTSHARSSYGMPVLLVDGSIVEPRAMPVGAELRALDAVVEVNHVATAEELEMLRGARVAGYPVCAY